MKTDEAVALTQSRLAEEGGSMGDLLKHFRNRISPILIGDDQWGRILDCAGNLPVTIGALPFGFELPLHEPGPEADLGVSLASEAGTAAFFRERAQADQTDETARAITRLFGQMDAENSPLREIVGHKMMLEFDIGSAPNGERPHPGMFVRPGVRPIVGGAGQVADVDTVVDALVASVGWERNDAQGKNVLRAYLAQPEDARLDAFGVFPSRSRAMRLAIMGFRTQQEISSFLETTGWPGQIPAVESVLARFKKQVKFDRTGVYLDVREDGLGPTLGLALIVKQRYTNDSRYWLDGLNDWDPLLEALGQEDLVVAEKLPALADWVSKPAPVFAKSGRYVLLRGIHHIKLVISENQLCKAKAYVFMVLSGAVPF